MVQSKPKLLVVDEDTSVRQEIVLHLEDSGFSVHQESDGKSAVQWATDNLPALVVADLKIPGMDGLSILQAIHQINPETPVIVISAVGAVHDVVQALRLGAADYLIKPLVDMEVLVHSIHRALEHARLRQDNLRYRSELELANKELREYVRVLERDHQAGRRLQSNLLPRTPFSAGGLEISYKIFPSLYLSGDFVDYGFQSDRYLSFYLVDVSGHGAAPAFVTIWLQQLVRHYYREREVFSEPKKFEQDSVRLLKMINGDVIKSRFDAHMTCFVGVIDTHTREMRYVVGGHLPLPLLVTSDQAHYLRGKGKPVGIFDDAEWQGEVIQLPVDKPFNILVFSDGVLEILSEPDLIGKENQLRELFSGNKGGLENISEMLNIDSHSSVPDDVAILQISGGALK